MNDYNHCNTAEALRASCTHQRVFYRPVGGNAEGWTPCWVCDVCRTEFVPEAHLRHLRETASGVIDALSHQGAATFEKAWDELCLLCGRHCEPYLSVNPPGGMTQTERNDFSKVLSMSGIYNSWVNSSPEERAEQAHSAMLAIGALLERPF
jgi:hypothetical protein